MATMRESVTIMDVMQAFGFQSEHLNALPAWTSAAFDRFYDWDTSSHCGERCARLVELALPLLREADPASHATIWEAMIHAMSIVCLG